MIVFRKSLKESAKIGRHRRNILNILLLIIAWLAETVGICTVIIGKIILRNEHSIATLCLQLMTNSIYFVIVPALYLVDTDKIIKSSWFPLFLSAFGCQYKNSRVGVSENESQNIPNEGCRFLIDIVRRKTLQTKNCIKY